MEADTVRAPATSVSVDWQEMTPEDRAILEGHVPSPLVADMYVNRRIGGKLDFDILAAAMDLQMNVLLTGPTGSAKTTVGKAFAAKHGLPFTTVALHGGIDIDNIAGRWVPSADALARWLDSVVTCIMRNGGVVVWDEYNMAHPDTLARLHEVLDRRRQMTRDRLDGSVVKALPGKVLFLGTMNENYEGTHRVNPAQRNRFPLQMDWPYDRFVEASVVEVPSLIDFAFELREAGIDVDGNGNRREIRTPVATNMLQEYVIIYESLGAEFAATNWLAHFAANERAGVARVLELYRPAIDAEIDALIDQEDGELDG